MMDLAYAAGTPCDAQPTLARRMRNLNTAVAEQVFSWFRGYARSINELRADRHVFIVRYFCKLHNELCDNGQATHLNAVATGTKRKRGNYQCSK